MSTKLTLSIKENIIIEAKKYAKSKKVSLSKLVENYLNSLTIELEEQIEITPLVESLSGVISLEKNSDDKNEYRNYLNEKYK